MAMNPTKRCETCAAFAVLPEQQCRREQPKVRVIPVQGQIQVAAFWPPTRPENWCLAWVAGHEAGETPQ